MLREEGLRDLNIVPVEILRTNKKTQSSQKERALFQCVPIAKAHISSILNSDFKLRYKGYVYYINRCNDSNKFPMGILLPKKLVNKISDIDRYTQLIYNKLNGNCNGANNNNNGNCNSENDKYNKCYVKPSVTLVKGCEVCLDVNKFENIKRYHKLVFKLLSGSGSSKKRNKLIENENENENERYYLICPLQKNCRNINWKCVNSIIGLEKHYNNNIALGMKYVGESNNKMRFQLIQAKNSKSNNTNMLILNVWTCLYKIATNLFGIFAQLLHYMANN